MVYTKKIKINIENDRNISFDYIYNQNSTFEDLLEFTLNIFPESNICPCFEFKYQNNKKKLIDINKNSKINEYISKIHQFYLVINSSDKKCHCNSLYNNYFKRRKIEILRSFDEYINDTLEKEKNNVQNNIDSFENEKTKLSSVNYQNIT